MLTVCSVDLGLGSGESHLHRLGSRFVEVRVWIEKSIAPCLILS